jgi:hypothetical protein
LVTVEVELAFLSLMFRMEVLRFVFPKVHADHDDVESGPESNLSERDHADLHNTTRSTLMVGAERAQRAACNSFAANT